MAEVCIKCGKKIGGLLGLASADESRLDLLRKDGVDVPQGMCHPCSVPYLEAERKTKKPKPFVVPDVPIFTYPPADNERFTNVGIASAHVAMGTGPISQILSSINDLFGEQSETYSKKMIEAEDACLAKLKIRAHEMGADAVIGMHTTYTELTSGHGMLLVCMTGTAVKKLESKPPA